jgi:hypothetical protein
MWNSTSRTNEGGVQYGFADLDVFFNHIGCNIETQEGSDDGPLQKDAECELHVSAYLQGITNGEFLYAVYEILYSMVDDAPCEDIPMHKEAVLATLIDGLRDEFLDRLGDEFPYADAEDIWRLYVAIRRLRKVALWTNNEGEEVAAPRLQDITSDAWASILEEIHDEFLWDRDWEIEVLGGGNFALLKVQPHFPSFQEFRTAKTWLMSNYAKTRQNSKEGRTAGVRRG